MQTGELRRKKEFVRVKPEKHGPIGRGIEDNERGKERTKQKIAGCIRDETKSVWTKFTLTFCQTPQRPFSRKGQIAYTRD